jgi:cold shock CspA family protein
MRTLMPRALSLKETPNTANHWRTDVQTPVEIGFQGMTPTATLQQAVAEHIAALETRFGRITSGRVVIKGPGGRHNSGGLYDINIRLVLPNAKEVDVSHTAQDDERYSRLDYALNGAFKRARRQLQDRVRRLQGKTKHHESAPTGTVDRIDASGEFGFLRTSDGRDIYFHRNSVLDGGFDKLKPGTAVTFVEEEGEKGPQASTVHVAGRHGLRTAI